MMPQPSWQDLYPVHPCADVYPMMSDQELAELSTDIEAHRLQKPIVLWRQTPNGPYFVLDGRNRLAALVRLGVEIPRDPNDDAVFRDGHTQDIFTVVKIDDPAAYVISANIRRRHLTKEQQAELILRTLEAARLLGKDDSATVARSFNLVKGKRGGSTADPILAAAVIEGEKHGISRRTFERARAKVQGKPTLPRRQSGEPSVPDTDVQPATPASTDDQLTALRRHGDRLVHDYIKLMSSLTVTEAQNVYTRWSGWTRQIKANLPNARRAGTNAADVWNSLVETQSDAAPARAALSN